MIRIMLVDDQRFARLGFQLMLDDASDIVVTAQSADGRSAIETLEQLAVQHRPLPNVILMDVRMPGMDGIEATRRITRRWPTISILILTTYDEDDADVYLEVQHPCWSCNSNSSSANASAGVR